MKLTEFLVNSPKLNEIPKPGIKSQLNMEPHDKQMCHTNKNNLRFAATILLFIQQKKYYIFVLLEEGLLKRTFIQIKLFFLEEK